MGGNARTPRGWGLVPARHREEEDQRQRAALILASSACLTAVCLAFALFYRAQGLEVMAGGLLGLVAMQLLTPVLLRLCRSLELAAQLIISSSFLGLFAAVWWTGGPASPGVVWVVSIPMLGLFLSGWRACLLWTLLSGVALSGLGFAAAAGLEFPALSSRLPFWFRNLVSNGGLLVCVLGLLAVAEASRRRAQVRLAAANRALAEARDAALAQAGLKSRFLATVSHEIRTPMNAVIGLSELLLASPMSSAQRGLVRTIRSSGHELLRLIDDVLSYAKNEAEGAAGAQLAWFELGELVDDVLELLAEPAHRKGLELWPVSDLEPGARVRTDPTRLRQILVNLIGNAIKFTERGEISVRIGVSRAPSAERARLRFEVWDTGVGLPALQADVFEPFARSAQGGRAVEGTGLGLSISKQLVEQMNGRMGAENRPDGGANFWFELELELEAAAPAPGADPSPGPVLVLEPSPWGRESLARLLQGLGCPHEVAPSFSALSELSRRRSYRAVLTRYECTSSPGASGSGLEREPSLRASRFLVLARMSQTIDESSELLGGRAAVLARPVRRAALEAALARPSVGSSNATPTPGVTERRGLLVLVVDDNRTNRQILELQLQALGHRTVQVASGEAALSAAEEASFDAVFMDCQMPGMGGVEAIRRLRAREPAGARRPLIVAITASVLSEDWSRCRGAGADEVITKPVELATLRRALEPGDFVPAPDRPAQIA